MFQDLNTLILADTLLQLNGTTTPVPTAITAALAWWWSNDVGSLLASRSTSTFVSILAVEGFPRTPSQRDIFVCGGGLAEIPLQRNIVREEDRLKSRHNTMALRLSRGPSPQSTQFIWPSPTTVVALLVASAHPRYNEYH